MKVAIEGCCHGSLDLIYHSLKQSNVKLLIICGDFQSTRNQPDLDSMSVPNKYKKMGDFQDYYTGIKKAPIFTVFVGGNHEASTYLEELKYGGFVAPNIFYMGRSSIVWYKGLRIGGLSGIYSNYDFMRLNKGVYDFQRDRRDIKSVYHYRKDDYLKLRIIDKCNKMIMVSHDWPEGIYNYGKLDSLLKSKPFFKADIKKQCLGSPFNMQLLNSIRPANWFSAHLHVRFTAEVSWGNITKRLVTEEVNRPIKKSKIDKYNNEICLDINDSDSDGENANKDEIALSLDSENDNTELIEVATASDLPTKFLSLDKCLPKRKFIEILNLNLTDENHISTQNENQPLFYDEEYISAHRTIEKYKLLLDKLNYSEMLCVPLSTELELKKEKNNLRSEYQKLETEDYKNLFKIPMDSFVQTADPDARTFVKHNNPQTTRFEENFLQL